VRKSRVRRASASAAAPPSAGMQARRSCAVGRSEVGGDQGPRLDGQGRAGRARRARRRGGPRAARPAGDCGPTSSRHFKTTNASQRAAGASAGSASMRDRAKAPDRSRWVKGQPAAASTGPRGPTSEECCADSRTQSDRRLAPGGRGGQGRGRGAAAGWMWRPRRWLAERRQGPGARAVRCRVPVAERREAAGEGARRFGSASASRWQTGEARRTRVVHGALEALARGGALDRRLKRRRQRPSRLGVSRGQPQQLVQRCAAAARLAQPAGGGGGGGAAAVAVRVGGGRQLRGAERVGAGGEELREHAPAAEGERLRGRGNKGQEES
jgi:hypothetical protein